MTPAIPSVRDQVRRWRGGPAAQDADAPQREALDARDLKILGNVGRRAFARTPDGRELKVKGPVHPHQLEQIPDDAVLVTKLVRAADGQFRTDTYLATPIEPGTFEKLQRQKTYRPKGRQPGPIDGLAELRNAASRKPVTLDSNDDGTPEAVIIGALSRRPLLMLTDGRDVPATVAGLIEAVNAAGGNLRYYRGRTLCDWNKLRRWNALLVASWPLVDAHMAGKPLQCAYEHDGAPPPAATLDPGGNPTCNACVGVVTNA